MPPTAFTGAVCVRQADLIAINSKSSYWPNCASTQPAKGSATGYVWGNYCDPDWVANLNKMLAALGYCNQGSLEIVRNFLAQTAYETAFWSTLGQPLDAGSGVIHMIPQNFAANAADMETVFPGQGIQAHYDALPNAAAQAAFFKDPAYAWMSAAAWFKLTNRVIPGCGEDLFTAPFDTQTRCILGRVVDRSEFKGFVDQFVTQVPAA